MSDRRGVHITDWPDGAAWQRRRLESDAAWMAFFTYLGLPHNQRSLERAYREFTGRENALAPGQWSRWMKQYHWSDRVMEYERWVRSREQIAEEQAQAAENAKWEAIRQAERERNLKIGQALLEKAQAMLAFPLAEVEKVVSVYDNGQTREVQIFKPAGWNFGTVARMIEVGSKIVQLMTQMATEHHRIDLGLIYDEADRVAKQIGGDITREDVLMMAEKIAQEHQERREEEGRGER